MGLPIYTVDAFTDRPFAGNPAAVCLLDGPRDDAWMQRVAAEMNLSETAFLLPEGDSFRLRWFTPTVEVDLCGHATVASAHVLCETNRLPADRPARFLSRSGPLSAARRGNEIELDFPAKVAEPCPAPAGLTEALGATPRWVGRNKFDFLVELESDAAVRGLTPDFARLATLPVRGVIVTAKSATAGADFVSRFFAPQSGVAEDPATGSSHCALGPFWRDRLGRAELTGYQASARGGTIGVAVVGDRVKLRGRAVTALRGELAV
jgi:predicted PhzF superfamily epimerase YddE/YHI9